MEPVKDVAFIKALFPLLIVIFAIGVGVVLLYQHFQKNIFVQKLRHQELKNVYQNDLLRCSIQAQEDERRRIAHDLHDELGAVLSIMRMNVVLLLEQPQPDGPALPGRLQNICSLAETAIASVRHISHRLMPPQLEVFGLVRTLESVIGPINQAGPLRVTLLAPEGFAELPWPVSLGLYRILMELLNNTIKHSGAAYACIELTTAADAVVCRYQDDGKGIAAEESKGLGRKSIEGRINSLNGTFEAGDGPAGGFGTVIRIPLQHRPPDPALRT